MPSPIRRAVESRSKCSHSVPFSITRGLFDAEHHQARRRWSECGWVGLVEQDPVVSIDPRKLIQGEMRRRRSSSGCR